MKYITVNNSLFLAGSIIIFSAFISQFSNAKLITSTLLTLLGGSLLFWSIYANRNKKKCLDTKAKPFKTFWVTTFVLVMVLAFGFSVGKLVYLWIN